MREHDVGQRTMAAGAFLILASRIPSHAQEPPEFDAAAIKLDQLGPGPRGEERRTRNPPHATFKGQDAQLEMAIRYLEEQIRSTRIRFPRRRPIRISLSRRQECLVELPAQLWAASRARRNR